MATVQKITANLWFATEAVEAAKYYVSIFKKSKLGQIAYYSKDGFEVHKMPEGTPMTVEFELEGQSFLGLNGGPIFKFNEAVSFIVNCDTQEEIDYYWDKLSEGGDKNAQVCGWLKDKYGLSWQIVPVKMREWATDPKRSGPVMTALLKMKKLDIKKLEEAFKG